jgi:hypothetical protein
VPIKLGRWLKEETQRERKRREEEQAREEEERRKRWGWINAVMKMGQTETKVVWFDGPLGWIDGGWEEIEVPIDEE